MHRNLLLGALVLAFQSAPALAQNDPFQSTRPAQPPQRSAPAPQGQISKTWLVGIWEGEIGGGYSGGRLGSYRALHVQDVQPNGVVRGCWAVRSGNCGGLSIQMDGDTIRFTTGRNSPVVLRRAGERLEGTIHLLDAGGGTYPVSLARRR